MSNAIVKPVPYTVDLNEPVKKTYIDTLLATEDNLAHCFDISLMRGAEAVALPDGTAVTAYFIRCSDNATISLTGTASGNVISVTLNKSCYNKAGQYAVIIKVAADGVVNTVFYGEGTIFTSITDTILDPENVVPSLSDLLAQIEVMEAATKAANTATANANTATSKANTATANANAAAEKIDGMTVSAVKADEAGATVSEVDGVKHIAFALPKGDKGDKGDPGTIENVTITSIAGLEEALAGKLGTNETAANANQLNGKNADNYMLKTDTAADSNKLDGKTPDHYLYHEVKFAAGHLVNSGDDPIEGHGIANVTLYPNGIAKIEYEIQITTAGVGSDVYAFGLNTHALRTINADIPSISPASGGSCVYYRNDQIYTDTMGYAGTHSVYGEFWQFARMYDEYGAIGAWPTNMWIAGDRIVGTCFGTYERG